MKRLLSLDAEHSELQVRQGIPASPLMAAWDHQTQCVCLCNLPAFLSPTAHLIEPRVSWAGFTACNSYQPVLSDLPWHGGGTIVDFHAKSSCL